MSNVDLTRIVTAADKAQKEKIETNKRTREQAQRYLAETDWYVTRLIEIGKPVPEDVLRQRATCRESIIPYSSAK